MKHITIACVLIATLTGTVALSQEVPRMAVFTAFKQGSRGNCSSVAAIKAAINTFGTDSVFLRVVKTSAGYDIVLRNRGERISITNDEIDKARKESDLVPDTLNNIYNKAVYELAIMCYVVVAKGRDAEEQGESFNESLAELGKGQRICNVFKWLGLEDYIHGNRKMSGTAGIKSLVVASRKHAAFTSYGETDLWGKIRRVHVWRPVWVRFLPQFFWSRVVLEHDPRMPDVRMIAFSRSWNEKIGVGGISGIEWNADDGFLYAVTDTDPWHLIRAAYQLDRNTVKLEKQASLDLPGYDSISGFESIRLRSDSIYISEETHEENTKTAVRATKNGSRTLPKVKVNKLPVYLRDARLQHNSGIEGLSFPATKDPGYWIATERPLLGVPDSIKHPVTYVRNGIGKSYRYRIDNFPDEDDRGISEILAYDDHRILFLERHYDNQQDKVFARIYMGTMLQNRDILKTLLIDLNKLQIPKVDNYEGMCWGPKLPNNNRTLILIADDNLGAKWGQNTDMIVFEIR